MTSCSRSWSHSRRTPDGCPVRLIFTSARTVAGTCEPTAGRETSMSSNDMMGSAMREERVKVTEEPSGPRAGATSTIAAERSSRTCVADSTR